MGLGGTSGRRLAARLDLVRATGVRHALGRLGDAAKRDAMDAGRARVYARLWREAADAVGVELPANVRESHVGLDGPKALARALDKGLVGELLRDAGLPVPAQLEVGSASEAIWFLAGGPCVVKPADGSAGGVGVTSGVETPPQLRRAFRKASVSGPRVLVERQLAGDVYRLLFLDGELLDVVRRGVPTVTGDGRSGVDALIARENERRLREAAEVALDLLSVDLDTVFCLAGQGLGLRSVPAAGRVVAVKRVTNESRPDENETSGACEELVAEAREAAELVGVRLAGVDVITTDARRSLGETGGAILEVNGTPGLHHHVNVGDRENAANVFVPVLEAVTVSDTVRR
jgi:cyanophycin synthetase